MSSYKKQLSFAEIQEACMKSGSLFEDPDFPAADISLFFSKAPPRPFVWKRPKDICDNPQFITKGASRFDVQQGMLGNCWLLSAVASLTGQQTLLNKVLDPTHSFTDSKYCGAVKFNLWHQGEWIEVVVDDRLPTYNNKLVFLHSNEENEFWSALLEKAFAKLSGSYEGLKGGQSSEALEDLTGGLAEAFDLQKAPEDLFKIVQKGFARSSIMCCSIEAKPNEIEAKLDNGLIKGHGYSVTDVREVKGVPLIRIRNPWGNEREWTGAWSDESSEWSHISDSEKKDIGLTYDDDGEFWMSFEDFKKNFTRLEMCSLGPESPEANGKISWSGRMEHGAWRKGTTAGGCRNFIQTFAMNPQFRLTITDPDEGDDDNTGTAIIALLQKDRRAAKIRGCQNLTIGFTIYELEDPKVTRLDTEFFQYHKTEARVPNFANTREVVGRFKLKPGNYIIVPSTFKANEEGEFLLRIFTEKATDTKEIGEETRVEERHDPRPGKTDEDMKLKDRLKGFFQKVSGQDEQIDCYELLKLLETVFKKEKAALPKGSGLTVETARALISSCDSDMTGKCSFDEFVDLWKKVNQVQTVFKKYDQNGNGCFSTFELRDALKSFGISVSNPVLNAIALRYNNNKNEVSLADFLLCISRIEKLYKFYKDHQGNNLNLDDFLIATL
ncbi:hypothetical protein EGW08_007623 [Elysia chlorotica]|uniref:Calpain-3 n=1 Tax=Elysia chlorotica TaxID=188477 RepID=A0A3S0ZS82_ELYCH|nr:hypothetical protein EGW08_007623 [Elysia chlorotica]